MELNIYAEFININLFSHLLNMLAYKCQPAIYSMYWITIVAHLMDVSVIIVQLSILLWLSLTKLCDVCIFYLFCSTK